MLCEAAWVLVRTPGPMRAFYERVCARRGAQIALVATARKLSVLFWHLLTREEDYAFQRPTLTRRKLRGLELKAADGRRSWPSGHALSTKEDREREREFARQVETAYRRLVADWQPKASRSGAGATRGRLFKSSSWRRDSSAAGISPRTCAIARRRPHRQRLSHKGEISSRALDFHPPRSRARRSAAARASSGLA